MGFSDLICWGGGGGMALKAKQKRGRRGARTQGGLGGYGRGVDMI